MKRILLTFLVFPFCLSTASMTSFDDIWRQAEYENWGHTRPWQRLLHYRRTSLGLYRSGIDSPEFFLSKEGKKSPELELKATLKGLLQLETYEETACRFPARTHWLRTQKKIAMPAQPLCERFENWRKKLAPEGISIVFASYYFNNPASMYGHTFIKLHRAGLKDKSGLLDYTVNYAAVTNTSNGLLFALRGLTGLYHGKYSTDPYYFKIQKYNNIESRDLWEYRLNFTQKELDQLVRHMWELGPAWARYYFFNRNCSYELLPFLEAARPDLDLSADFWVRAIPLDTLKQVVNSQGLLNTVHHRPSRAQRLLARAERLNKDQIKLAKKLGKNPTKEKIDQFHHEPSNKKSDILELALDFWRGDAGHKRDLPEEVRQKERTLLLLLKELTPAHPLEIPPDNPPHIAHGTLQWRAGFGADKQEPFTEFGVRPALHDLNSDPTGFIEGSQLQMFNLTFRHRYREGQLFLKEGTLIDILSLTPMKVARRAPSWGMRAAFETPDDINMDRRLSGVFRGGTGVTFKWPVLNGMLMYGMAQGEAAAGPQFRDGYRAGGGGSGGLWLLINSWSRLHLTGSALRFGAGHPGNVVRLDATQTFNINRDIEIRAQFSRANHHSEARLTAVLNR